jgi:hypothetical protein
MAWSFVIAGEAALVRLTFVDLIRKHRSDVSDVLRAGDRGMTENLEQYGALRQENEREETVLVSFL